MNTLTTVRLSEKAIRTGCNTEIGSIIRKYRRSCRGALVGVADKIIAIVALAAVCYALTSIGVCEAS